MTSKLSGPPFSWEPRLVTNVSVSKSPPWSEKDKLTSTVFFLQNRHRERVFNHRIINQGAALRRNKLFRGRVPTQLEILGPTGERQLWLAAILPANKLEDEGTNSGTV